MRKRGITIISCAMKVVFDDEEERDTPRLTGSLQDLYEVAFAPQMCAVDRSSISFRTSLERRVRDWLNHSQGLGRSFSVPVNEQLVDGLVCHAMVSSAYRSFNQKVAEDILKRWEQAGCPLDSRWMERNFDVCRPLDDYRHIFD